MPGPPWYFKCLIKIIMLIEPTLTAPPCAEAGSGPPGPGVESF